MQRILCFAHRSLAARSMRVALVASLAVLLGLATACSDDAASAEADGVADAASGSDSAIVSDADSTAGSDADETLEPGADSVADSVTGSDAVSAAETMTDADEAAETVSDAAPEADTASDGAPQSDTSVDAASAADGAADGDLALDSADAAGCPAVVPFTYLCTGDPLVSCPGGACMLGMCIGPKLDPDRWKDCGDGTCAACELASQCPADCGAPPKITGTPLWDDPKTITVWVHGFSNNSGDSLDKAVYGSDKGCGGLIGTMTAFGVDRPCGDTVAGASAPNHLIGVEYYGKQPAAWLSPADVAEIDQFPYDGGPTGLPRYALITAKFIAHKMAVSGAQHVNLVCHSMGCLVSRHLIEHDLEALASSAKIVRWSTTTGVIAGARLARLFDNPTIQQGATTLGLELNDFVIMNPDLVQDTTAAWDHKLYAGNNPLFGHVLIHHTAATDPKIAQALNVQLLDLNNPGDEPNDGIMYTLDQFFHTQAADAAFVTPAGQTLPSTHSFVHVDHMACPGTEAAALLAAAGLFHSRKVVVELVEFELFDDKEKNDLFDFGDNGMPPAELVVEVEIRFDPYVQQTFGKTVLVHEAKLAHRSVEMWTQAEGTTTAPDQVVFAGPVFDAMTAMHAIVTVQEVDWYQRFNVVELGGLLNVSKDVVGFAGALPLQDGAKVPFENKAGRGVLQVHVYTMY